MIEDNNQPLKLVGMTAPRKGYFGQQEYWIIPDGDYHRNTLVEVLSNQWIPFLECHHCGRFSYCKYVQRNPRYPEKALEIRCGVAVEALGNFLLVSWEKLLAYESDKLERFFRGLYHFIDFVYHVEVMIGNLIDRDHLNWAGTDLGRRTFGYFPRFRGSLDSFAAEFQDLWDFYSEETWILVEGPSEVEFFSRLIQLQFLSSDIAKVQPYEGKANSKNNKVYIRRLQERGYLVAIQGDMDRSATSPLDGLISDGLVNAGMTFRFNKDFEGAFPSAILHKALEICGYEIEEEWLVKLMSKEASGPIVKDIERKLGRSIDKKLLARGLADVIQGNWHLLSKSHKTNEIVSCLMTLQYGRAVLSTDTDRASS